MQMNARTGGRSKGRDLCVSPFLKASERLEKGGLRLFLKLMIVLGDEAPFFSPIFFLF